MQRRSQRGETVKCIPELGAVERANNRAARERKAKEKEDRSRGVEMENQGNIHLPEMVEEQPLQGGVQGVGIRPRVQGVRLPGARPIGAFDAPNLREVNTGIPTPTIGANNFEVKSSLISMAQNQRYNGLPLEDPLDHLDQFERLCRTVKMNGVPEDAIKMILFPFSLGNKAAQWEKNVPSELVSTWDNVKREFVTKFYPKQKTAKLRNDITSFKQGVHENLYEAWDRLKDYTRKCPHHGVSKENLLGIFYRGTLEQYRRALDTASYGCFSNLTVEEGEQLIDNLAESEACYGGDYDRSGSENGSDSQRQIRELNEKIDKLSRIFLVNQKSVNYVGETEADQQGFQNSAGDGSQGVQEEVNYLGNQNGYQGGYQNRPYNQNLRNNNLSYRSNNVENPQDQFYPPRAPQGNQYQQRGFGNLPPPQNQSWRSQGAQNPAPAAGFQGETKYRPPSLQRQNAYPQGQPTDQDDMKSMMKQLMDGQVKVQQELNEKLDKFERKIDSHHAESQAKFADVYSHLKNLDNQVAQIASTSKRPAGTLPGKPDPNPKEYINAVEVRVKEEKPLADHHLDTSTVDEMVTSGSFGGQGDIGHVKDDPLTANAELLTCAITVRGIRHFPPCLQQPTCPEKPRDELKDRHKILLEMLLRKVTFTPSLIDLFLEHPGFPKPLKVHLNEKKKELKRKEMHNKGMKTITRQEKDPGRFTLPCTIGALSFPRSLCDLGAGMNLMPLSVAERLGMTNFSECEFEIVLADRSVRQPEGLLKDLPVMVGDYMIATDFVVMKMDEESRDPILLGRPFLATTRALIDVKDRQIHLRLGDETLKFELDTKTGKSTMIGRNFNVTGLIRQEECNFLGADKTDVVRGPSLTDNQTQELRPGIKRKRDAIAQDERGVTKKLTKVMPEPKPDEHHLTGDHKHLIRGLPPT